ncbi:M15 family metallopeptidase [Demequina globuliformis]|uniref:M15 family metallopeptidase n=1 Tax=Demequina globuliformis TaxID=676202 RepID=UPI0007859476|nr:M15 family metallopeptidase [Demequina globuliformis]
MPGQVPLEIGAYDLGVRADTPEELQDRQFEPREWLPDPETDEWFVDIGAVPDDVAERSSWVEGCPAPLSDLAYVVMPYWGFDGEVHTGEMITNAKHAEDVAGAFEKIFAAQFPIEEMRVISLEEHLSPTTGDHNITSSFTCRRVVAAPTYWSEHAYGLAIDINPFHNPFVKDDALFPELSEAYLDRDWDRPGMIHDPSVVYDAFATIGWAWGGHWAGREDWMHFSVTGG